MATDAELLGALRAKLVAYESAGMTDLVKRVKTRIAELEKPAKAPAAAKPAAKKSTARKATKVSAAAKKSAATKAANKEN